MAVPLNILAVPMYNLVRGPKKGELVWDELLHCRAMQIIHNPRYAGAVVFGRRRQQRGPDGKIHW